MDENNVHFGTGESDAWWRRLTSRVVLIPFFALIFVGIGVWVIANMKSDADKKGSSVDNAIKAADAAFENGNTSESIEQLEAAAAKANTKEEKVSVYGSLSAAAATNGDMGKALDYLDEKHKADPATAKQDAYIEGSYYERMGEYGKAIEKYKIAIEYYNEQGDGGDGYAGEAQSLEERIKYLEAQ